MGVSGNFLAVALPGLTKHSPSQNPVNFRSFYPITESSTVEKKITNARKNIVKNPCSPKHKSGKGQHNGTFSIFDILIFSGFSFGTILENLLIENTQI